MSARDELRKYVNLLADAWTPRERTDERVEWLYAAVRTEVLAEAKREVIAWLVKKSREGTPVVDLASKVDRGAIRLFLHAEEKTTPQHEREAAVCPCTTPSEHTPEYHCVCRDDPATGPAHQGHETWCPARKPTPERITEIRQGIGDELTSDELAWLSGAAGRHELHIAGARAGEWPMRDLPGAVQRLSQYLAATVSVIERQRSSEAEEKTTTVSTTAGAAVTPDTERLNLLRTTASDYQGALTTRNVQRLYVTNYGPGDWRSQARRDLAHGVGAGWLTQDDTQADRRCFWFNASRGGA